MTAIPLNLEAKEGGDVGVALTWNPLGVTKDLKRKQHCAGGKSSLRVKCIL